MATAGDQIRGARQSVVEKTRVQLRSFLTPSQPVTSLKAFAGRTAILKRVIRAIEDERLHVVLYGSRGMGKTSLLHILRQLARDARYVVAYGSCNSQSSFNDIFRTLLGEIPLRSHPGHRGDSTDGATGNLADLLPSGQVSAHDVSELLVKLTGTRALIILDEFDRVESEEFRQAVADLIKALSDRSARAQLVIGGVGSNVNELIEHIPSIQRNIIGVQVGPMVEAEVRQLLKMTEDQVGLHFSSEAADMIVDLAGGWPYVASLLAHHSSLLALEEDRLQVTEEDARHAVARGRDDVASRLSPESMKETHFAGSREGYACLDLAARTHIASGGEFTIEDLRRTALHSGPRCDSSDAIARLADEKLLFSVKIDRFGNTYAFRDSTVPLFLWLARSAPQAEMSQRDSGRAA